MSERRRKFYAWGFEDQTATAEEMAPVLDTWHRVFGTDFEVTPAPTLETIEMRAPRITAIPAALTGICRQDRYERALHAYGRSFLDGARMFRGDFTRAPDVVAYPRTEDDIRALLDWAGGIGAAVIPFGGGSSVVGGVNPEIEGDYAGVVTIDMWHMNRLLEVDQVSRSARVQAGVYGPDLERQLKEHGLTLRHFPQSFELSTLGGWIATRAAGHFASNATYIDDYVESIRMVTPQGVSESRRLPASGAGPSPDRFVMGTEGSIGIITEAWIRVLNRPRFKVGATLVFDDYHRAAEAVRAISQSGLQPANCRLIDALEAGHTKAYEGGKPILVLGYESAHYPVDDLLRLTVELCADYGGSPVETSDRPEARSAVAGQWRNAFIRGPYYREHMIARGICRETFETAVPWSGFPELHGSVVRTVDEAIRRVTGRAGTVTCRFTHIYPNGPAPYFTFHCLPDRARMAEQCMEIKVAAYDAVMKAGGTITHHHAVGRLHMPWYVEQRPKLIGAAFAAAKRALDPAGIMNPGVIVPEADIAAWRPVPAEREAVAAS
ncbi:FAD-binding oxidoreductase [Amaricoccus sp.]|uniref:FAD-binding oxidoreductase n=1 Tax=Amaricoccus sp. TaxID=1872485 RepID=UPI002610CAAD|nr:FAD-binding oxidoreductase [Amaricoccus sp.]HRO11987.1 FAD-binding oxidoreductase [Amaricoccus sp.]